MIRNQNAITKKQIISLFMNNVKGKKHTTNVCDADEGQWLEKQMKLKPNSNNAPDIGGYEMKKDARKITFGDWSGEYLFSQKKDLIDTINNKKICLSKEQFVKYFGKKHAHIDGRYSWSGSCIPKYGIWNNFGQMLKIDNDNNILIMYSDDKRTSFDFGTETASGMETGDGTVFAISGEYCPFGMRCTTTSDAVFSEILDWPSAMLFFRFDAKKVLSESLFTSHTPA